MANIQLEQIAAVVAKELKRQYHADRKKTTDIRIDEFTLAIVGGFMRNVRDSRTTAPEFKAAIRAELERQAVDCRLTLPPETGALPVDPESDTLRVVGRIDLDALAEAVFRATHV